MGKRNESKTVKNAPSLTSYSWIFKYWAVPVALLISWFHQFHLYASHENQMFFSEIKEVEREISFRTEQGLYYNAFKTIVNSDSIYSGVKELMNDKTMEFPHTLNLIERLNIYQEIFLAVSWRILFKFLVKVAPIQFYLYSIFYLQAYSK